MDHPEVDHKGLDILLNDSTAFKTSEMELELLNSQEKERFCFIWIEDWSSLLYVLKFMGFTNI